MPALTACLFDVINQIGAMKPHLERHKGTVELFPAKFEIGLEQNDRTIPIMCVLGSWDG